MIVLLVFDYEKKGNIFLILLSFKTQTFSPCQAFANQFMISIDFVFFFVSELMF